MRKKFLVSLALVAGIGITGFATTAFAGDVSDEKYEFVFSSGGSVSHTEARKKYDSTSVYMRHDWMTSGHGRYHVKVVNSNGNDFSQVFWSDYFYASTPSGTVARIPNYSYEDRGVGMIKLKGEGRGGAAGTGMWYAKGVWSPDSV